MRAVQVRLERRLRVPDSEEIGALAEAMNDMAASLDLRNARTASTTFGEQPPVFSLR